VRYLKYNPSFVVRAETTIRVIYLITQKKLNSKKCKKSLAPVKREPLREVAEPEEKIQFSVNTFE
jgi:hypothetical protein